MDNDFNPFDLSAPPKKPLEEKPKEPEAPQPTVKRVSMGPIFHSRIVKVIAFILGLVLSGLIGYTGMNYYLTQKDAESVTTNTSTTKLATDATINAQAVKDAASQVSEPTATTKASTTTEACGVKDMPAGVCTIITSIEKDGIKNNKYISADTSQLPANTVTEVDEKTWTQPGPELGNVAFTAKYSGKTYQGIAYFQLTSGTWKVINYTLS